MVIVDRLRTVNGAALDVVEHVERFEQSCQAVGIKLPSRSELVDSVNACAEQYFDHFSPRDFSVVMLATPGRIGTDPPQPTLMFQAVAIEWNRLASWYRDGQRLVVASHRNVPATCWSAAIKTRARLQYYLADRQARLTTGDKYAGALLLDTDGFVSETSSANVLIVEGEQLCSPRSEKILNGISLRRTRRLAEQIGFRISEEDIPCARALQADAILLCGSTGCLWPTAQLEDRTFEGATQQPVVVKLVEAWKNELQFDFVEQCKQYQLDAPASGSAAQGCGEVEERPKVDPLAGASR